jgi:DNA gyrase subunit A
MKTYKLPLTSPQAKGRALVNLLPIEQDEKITTILPLPEDQESWKDLNIAFATASGQIRKNSMDQFADIRASGKIAMKLDNSESLIGVNVCSDNDDIMLSTKNGKSIRFASDSLRVFQSRNSTGVRGVKLEKGNEVIDMSILKHSDADMLTKEKYLKIPTNKRIELRDALIFNEEVKNNKKVDLLDAIPRKLPKIDSDLTEEQIQQMALDEEFILTITENGFGKRTSAYEYRITNRGGVGITNIITSKRNGEVVASFPIDHKDQVMLITDNGTLIRTKIDTVRVSGRNTQGVTLIKTKNEKVSSVARIAGSEEEEVDEGEE